MFGRASVFLVLGFSGILLMYTQNLFNFSSNSVDVYTQYYTNTVAENITASAANLACNKFFLDPTWTQGYSNVSYSGGSFNASVSNLANNRKKIVATGTYSGITKTVEVILQPSSFARFGYYAAIMPGNLYYVTGDTVSGPMHIQGKLNVSGSPVFTGKVTTKNGIKMLNASSTPQFLGGYESGVDLPLPSTVNTVSDDAAAGGKYFSNTDVWLTFNANGSVDYKVGSAGVWSNEMLSTFAPNGVIAVDRGNLHIKGTLKGKITIGATLSSGSGSGNVYLDDDIVYSTNPLSGSCTDMLGIVATNNVIIADNAANKNDININASIFSLKGGLQAENYSTIPNCGTIRLTGGLIEYQAQATGVFNAATGQITNGYNSNIHFDERFMNQVPPSFPKSATYEILSWLE